MADLDELRKKASVLRANRDKARSMMRSSVLQMQSVEQKLAELRRAHADRSGRNEEISRLERGRDDLKAAIEASRSELGSARQSAIKEIGSFFGDPRELISGLDDAIPFLLLPVRI